MTYACPNCGARESALVDECDACGYIHLAAETERVGGSE